MANTFLELSTTAASNTEVGGISIQGTAPVSNFDGALRSSLAILRAGLDGKVVQSSKSANYTAVADDNNGIMRFSAAATLSLTAAASLGANWHLTVVADGGAVTIDPNGSETINGATTLVLPNGYSTVIWCDGTNFRASQDFLRIDNWIDVASATTTDIGAAASQNVTITGTTTITGLGTAAAGTFRRVRFAGALTLTHNGTSLILPGAGNITTAAGDVFEFISEGSGNWRCVGYSLARGLGWEPITTRTPSSALSENVTDLSTFEALRITGFVKPSIDGSTFYIRTSTDNGSNYDSGASAYAALRLSQQSTSVSGSAAGFTYLPINQGITIGNAANEFLHFVLTIDQFNKSNWMSLVGDITGIDTTGAGFQERISGYRQDATARNAIEFGFTSGNIASGTIRVEGWRG